MDYQDIIKLEEQSPIYSTGNNSPSVKQCMAAFYDNDSDFDRKDCQQQLPQYNNLSFEQAIDYIQNYIDIVDTPLEDILNCFERLQCAEDLDKTILAKKILKRKSFLKRYRAKNRMPKYVCPYEPFSVMNSTNGMETEAEIKKKRNRVSAQVSRDRKKQYFKELQQKNKKLEQEIIRTKIQNEKLRQMIERESKPKSREFSQTLNNKLTKLLIFLGIICLIGMLKETFISTGQSLSKFKSCQKIEQMGQFSNSQHEKMIQQGQRKVAQFLEETQVQQEYAEERKISSMEDIIEIERIKPDNRVYQQLLDKLADMKLTMQKKGN